VRAALHRKDEPVAKLIEITADPNTLPPFGQKVLGCTVRKVPPPTDLIYEGYRKSGFPEAAMNAMLSATVSGGVDHPAKVLEYIASKHESEISRSAFVEMYRLEEKDRVQGMPKFTGWAWLSDAMPLAAEFDTLPTHWTSAPTFEI